MCFTPTIAAALSVHAFHRNALALVSSSFFFIFLFFILLSLDLCRRSMLLEGTISYPTPPNSVIFMSTWTRNATRGTFLPSWCLLLIRAFGVRGHIHLVKQVITRTYGHGYDKVLVSVTQSCFVYSAQPPWRKGWQRSRFLYWKIKTCIFENSTWKSSVMVDGTLAPILAYDLCHHAIIFDPFYLFGIMSYRTGIRSLPWIISSCNVIVLLLGIVPITDRGHDVASEQMIALPLIPGSLSLPTAEYCYWLHSKPPAISELVRNVHAMSTSIQDVDWSTFWQSHSFRWQ